MVFIQLLPARSFNRIRYLQTYEMASAALTRHDRGVLDHIKDPESGPAVPLLIDDSLPKDPHYTDASDYQTVAQRERAIIASIQQAEFQNIQASAADHLSQYLACIANLDELINEFPKYASARNNRAQALRRVYGDLVLVRGGGKDLSVSPALDAAASEGTIMDASSTILSDLDAAITLLTPRTSFAALSPQAAKTLSQVRVVPNKFQSPLASIGVSFVFVASILCTQHSICHTSCIQINVEYSCLDPDS